MIDLSPALKILFVLFFYCTITYSQTNYTTVGSGNYNDCSLWIGGCPSDPLAFGDSAFVNHVINLVGNIDVSGVMIINPGGELTGNKKLKIDPSGTLINNGRIDLQKEIHNDGSWYNNGYAHGQKVHNDGYICNTDTIEVDSDKKVDNHGGTIECGGLIIACEFKTHNNGGSSISGLSDTDICCGDGSDPIIDYQDGVIDSSTVSICGITLLNISLPIELLYFDVILENKIVKNNWITVSELNNHYFRISSSSDGVSFENLGKIYAAGNSNSLLSYEFIDNNPKSGTSYYKLTQVDFDGNSTVVGIKSIYIPPVNEVLIFPNPTKKYLNIDLYSETNSTINIEIYNAIGQVIYSNNNRVIKGANNYEIDVQSFPEGMYFLNIVSAKNTKLNFKFFKY